MINIMFLCLFIFCVSILNIVYIHQLLNFWYLRKIDAEREINILIMINTLVMMAGGIYYVIINNN